MALKDNTCTFFVDTLLKHTRRGAHRAPIELFEFKENTNMCVLVTLREYLKIAQPLRLETLPTTNY